MIIHSEFIVHINCIVYELSKLYVYELSKLFHVV